MSRRSLAIPLDARNLVTNLPNIRELEGVNKVGIRADFKDKKKFTQIEFTIHDKDHLGEQNWPLLGAYFSPDHGLIAHKLWAKKSKYFYANLHQMMSSTALGVLQNPKGCTDIYKLLPLDFEGSEWNVEKTTLKWDERLQKLVLVKYSTNWFRNLVAACCCLQRDVRYRLFREGKCVALFKLKNAKHFEREIYSVTFENANDIETKTLALGIGLILVLADSHLELKDALNREKGKIFGDTEDDENTPLLDTRSLRSVA